MNKRIVCKNVHLCFLGGFFLSLSLWVDQRGDSGKMNEDVFAILSSLIPDFPSQTMTIDKRRREREMKIEVEKA